MTPIYTALYDAISEAMDNVADMDTTRQDYARAATEAAMKACGPRGLVWDNHPDGTEWYCVTHESDGIEHGYMILSRSLGFAVFHGFCRRRKFIAKYFTPSEAKAAAQSHADAAHWANTVIGAEVGE